MLYETVEQYKNGGIRKVHRRKGVSRRVVMGLVGMVVEVSKACVYIGHV